MSTTPTRAPRLLLRAAFTPAQRRRLAGLFAVIACLHVAGFGLLLACVLSGHAAVSGGAGLFGVGLTAYTLGLRHAFDADHIGAIDNTTRKLLGDGQQPVSVGFFFALGHSTVVFVLAALLAVGVKGLGHGVADDGSTLHDVTAVIGPSVSGGFLLLIGLMNLAILVGILRVLRRMREGDLDESALEQLLDKRGVMNRLLARVSATVKRPGQMYPLGLLFGLGFDTATEIALLAAAAGAAATDGLPWCAILCLPLLFAAGMTLLDTIDGAFMQVAYGWAFARPVRKVYYNVTITALSVAVAMLVGTVETLQVLSDRLDLTGGVWDWLGGLDFNLLGYFIAGLFVLVWLVAVIVWRVGRIEERWACAAEA